MATQEQDNMTYEEFKTEYTKLFMAMNRYTLREVGSKINAERMADLADMYPAYEEMLENEHCA